MKESYLEHHISKTMGKAIFDYRMISPGDNLTMAVSGGKDSLTLARLLPKWRERAPFDFKITNVHIDMGDGCAEIIKEYFASEKMEITIKKAPISKAAERSYCYWCAKRRRDTMFRLCEELNCSKLVFAHHKDDIAETILMNLFFQGNISAMLPNRPIFDGKLNIIRPFAYVEERYIKKYTAKQNYPAMPECKYANDSKRALMKRIIEELRRQNRGIKENIFKAATRERIKLDYLLDKPAVSEADNSILKY